MLNYNKKVMKYFSSPKNVGEIKNADGVGKVGNMTCGDIMQIFIKVGKKKVKGKEVEYLKDVKFQTLGCVAAIATTSIVTKIAKGKTLKEAEKVTNKNVIKELGGLPPIKHHCSCLAEEALGEAIYNYLKKNNRPISKGLELKHKKALKSKNEFEGTHRKIK